MNEKKSIFRDNIVISLNKRREPEEKESGRARGKRTIKNGKTFFIHLFGCFLSLPDLATTCACSSSMGKRDSERERAEKMLN
jgi:hypothetical protein